MEIRFGSNVRKINSRSFLGPAAMAIIIIILLALVVIEVQLNLYTEHLKRQQGYIFYLEAQVEHLNADEWKVIAEKKLDPELVSEVETTRRSIKATLAQLAEGALKPQISRAFHEYTAAIDEEYGLIVAGKVTQAKEVDEERVDPGFETLRRVIQEAGQGINNAVERTAWTAYMESLLTFLLALLVILILFRKFKRSRIAEGLINSAYSELRNVFNSAAEGVRVIDSNFNIISVNQAFADLSGISEEEAVTKKCYETLEGPYCHTSQCTLKKILDGQERVEYTDIIRKRPDGTEIPCWLNAVPFLAPDGTVIGIVENLKNITIQKQAEEMLHRRIQFDQLITSLSTQFINCTPGEIDNQINYSLELLGEFIKVDRCYTFLFSDDGKIMDCTHEWCASGIELQIDKRKGMVIDSFPWFKDQIRRSGYVYIPDVDNLGREAGIEKELFKNRQIQSLLVVSITYEKSLIGFLGFDSVWEKITWSDEYISLLSIVGEIIANALIRQKTEKMLHASEERFRATFEQAAVGIVHAGLDGRWFLVNQKFCDMVGYTKEEAFKLKFSDITHPDDLEEDLEYVSQLLGGEIDTFSLDKRYIRKNGSIIWVNLTVSLVRELSGEFRYFIGVIDDITGRKEAENQIKEQKEFSENLLQNSTVPTFVLSPEHKVLIWNKACEELTGVKTEKVVGTDSHWQAFYDKKRPCISDVIIDDNLESLPSLYIIRGASNVVSAGLHAEGWFPNIGDRQRYLVLDSAPIRNSVGELTAVIETLQDFTEWKLAEQAIFIENERVQKDLQLANIVQSSLFPISLPALPGVSLAASTVPAKEIGGDYCDCFLAEDRKIGIAIGDVMGKGLPAALFAAMAYAFVRNYAIKATTPGLLINRLNEDMFPQLEFSGQFMTFFYGVYDPMTGELRYSNAGQNKPIVFRAASGECETLNVKNFYLGGRRNASYKEGNTFLLPGDIVLFYTDGLIEGRNKEKEEFGVERVIALLKEYSAVDPASIEEIITSEFVKFLNDENAGDDVTMLILKVNHVS